MIYLFRFMGNIYRFALVLIAVAQLLSASRHDMWNQTLKLRASPQAQVSSSLALLTLLILRYFAMHMSGEIAIETIRFAQEANRN